MPDRLLCFDILFLLAFAPAPMDDFDGEIAEDEAKHLLCGEQKIEVSNSGRPHNIDQRDGEDVHFS